MSAHATAGTAEQAGDAWLRRCRARTTGLPSRRRRSLDVMLPAEALRRIAFLLEAEGEASYKSQAFRRAAAAVDAVALPELEALRSRQRLASLPGLARPRRPSSRSAWPGRCPSTSGPWKSAPWLAYPSRRASSSASSMATCTAIPTGPMAEAR